MSIGKESLEDLKKEFFNKSRLLKEKILKLRSIPKQMFYSAVTQEDSLELKRD